jgi:hypothetical protein
MFRHAALERVMLATDTVCWKVRVPQGEHVACARSAYSIHIGSAAGSMSFSIELGAHTEECEALIIPWQLVTMLSNFFKKQKAPLHKCQYSRLTEEAERSLLQRCRPSEHVKWTVMPTTV